MERRMMRRLYRNGRAGATRATSSVTLTFECPAVRIASRFSTEKVVARRMSQVVAVITCN
jgi:hypothetical protein